MTEVNLFTVDVVKDEDDPGGYNTSYARVGKLLESEQLGMSVYQIPPGQSICPYHYEIGAEEWLLVLTGRPTLRDPDGEVDLSPWDVVFFPEGEAGAHKVTNNTEDTLRVAILSNKGDPGVAIYPDSDKVGVYPPNKLFRLTDAVDYWLGEAEPS